MRSKIIYLLAFILVGAIACEKKVEIAAEEKVDIAAEEEAIKAVLQKQLVVVSNLDYEGEAAVWAHEPYIYHASAGVVGWDSLSTYYKTFFGEHHEKLKEDPEYYTLREWKASNFDIHLNGNVAFVFHDEHYDYTMDGKEYSDFYRMLRYLEKKEGEWKVVAILPGG